jgi:multiple sugar transport system substrate-binding protein
MRQKVAYRLLNGGALAVLALGAVLGTGAVKAQDITINMAVPDWPPTRFMKEEFDRSFKSPSGKNVTLAMDFIPWPSFYERVAASLTSGEQKYQMIVTDSQWLGSFVEGGYYLDLTDKMKADPELTAIMKDLHPVLVSAYSTYPHFTAKQLEEAGEWPHPEARYFGFPQFPDTYVTYYRKDLFCNEQEAAKFQASFNQKLPCTYEDWQQVDWDVWANIGKHFQRKKGDPLGDGVADDDFYGIAYQAGVGYDFSTMQINAFKWQNGGSIWDETTAPKGQALGVVNSPEAVKALEHYLKLTQYMPPVVKTGGMDIFKTDELFREGKVASNIEWIGFAESSINPETSKVAGNVAFAQAPGLKGPDGKLIRWANIGGQPFVIMTWADDTQVKEAVDFVKWWLSPDVQHQFASQGGQSAMKSVYEDPKYITYRPWNRTWAPGLDWQKDTWHIPEFFELLVQGQEQYDLAITGQQDAKTTLDNIAAFQEELLKEAGHIED